MKTEKKPTVIRIASKIVNFAFFFLIIFTAVYTIFTFIVFIDTSQWSTETYLTLLSLYFKAAYIIMILYYLRKICNNLKLDQFFKPENIKNIKIIGYIVLLYSALISLHNIYQHFLIMTKISIIGLPFALKWEGFFIGLIILVISESFKKGKKIQVEQDLTI